MSTNQTIETLKQSVFELIAECKIQLSEGAVDIAEVETRVKAYCDALNALPIDEGRHHTKDLEIMMQAVTRLGNDLVTARDDVRMELESLGRLKNANHAYQKSDAIGGVYKKKGEADS